MRDIKENIMIEKRPPIPTELRRRVLIEAGHRCAIPTCRHIDVDVHHIIPWKKCKKNKYKNLIALCPNCHRRVHKNEIDVKSLKIYKANLRYTHDKFTQFEVDILFELYKMPKDDALHWPPYLMLLIKRLIDIGYVERIINEKPYGIRTSIGPQNKMLELGPDLLIITDKGIKFIEGLGVEHGW